MWSAHLSESITQSILKLVTSSTVWSAIINGDWNCLRKGPKIISLVFFAVYVPVDSARPIHEFVDNWLHLTRFILHYNFRDRGIVDVFVSECLQLQVISQDEKYEWPEPRPLWHSSAQHHPLWQNIADLNTLLTFWEKIQASLWWSSERHNCATFVTLYHGQHDRTPWRSQRTVRGHSFVHQVL